jgi:hypothetical protein
VAIDHVHHMRVSMMSTAMYFMNHPPAGAT